MSSTECPSGFEEINGDFCFAKGTEKKTFFEAKAACQQLGGFLAEPRSHAISNAITFFDFHQKPFFIGLRDIAYNRNFLWQTDYAALSYKDWEEDQPDNYGAQQKCVQINYNYKWDDCKCTEKLDYLCQANKGKFYSLVLEFIRNTNFLLCHCSFSVTVTY